MAGSSWGRIPDRHSRPPGLVKDHMVETKRLRAPYINPYIYVRMYIYYIWYMIWYI